jgi:hypothetical protein
MERIYDGWAHICPGRGMRMLEWDRYSCVDCGVERPQARTDPAD